LAFFATGDGYPGDREGISIYKCNNGTGYLLVSSQEDNTVKVYPREGAPGNPHQHRLITIIVTNGAEHSDGLDVTNRQTSADFPHGFLISHNSPGKNFRLFAWEDIAQTHLTICPATVGVGDAPVSMPSELALEQNYPNPFNASTNNRYQIRQFCFTFYGLRFTDYVLRITDYVLSIINHEHRLHQRRFWRPDFWLQGCFHPRARDGGCSEQRRPFSLCDIAGD
jgi:hypothetical protein